MKSTAIEWTDHTVNFWWGCDKVSPACTLCYADSWAAFAGKKLFGRPVEWGQGKPRAERLQVARAEALALNRAAQKKGVRYKVFVNSMSDWLDEEVPIEWLAFLLETLMLCPHLDWQLLTKRPENWRDRVKGAFMHWESVHGRADTPAGNTLHQWFHDDTPPPNLWIGTTVESQEWASKRIPTLLKIPAAVRFLSCEPLLGPVDPTRIDDGKVFAYDALALSIHWVIAGGESGRAKTVRPSHPDWFRSLRDQCAAAGVAFFFKQWGEWAPGHNDKLPMVVMSPGVILTRFGKDKTGRLLDGVEHSAFPITQP